MTASNETDPNADELEVINNFYEDVDFNAEKYRRDPLFSQSRNDCYFFEIFLCKESHHEQSGITRKQECVMDVFSQYLEFINLSNIINKSDFALPDTNETGRRVERANRFANLNTAMSYPEYITIDARIGSGLQLVI